MQPSKPVRVRFTEWLSPAVFLSGNPLSLAGVVLVTATAILWLFLLPTLMRGEADNPYLGIPAFLLLPGVFIFGLILIPAGMALRRASLRRQGRSMEGLPPLSFHSPELRRLLGFIAATTVANLVIVSVWGYSAVGYMDSDAFCGTTCHTVMQPEYTAYLNSAHARVGCVGCHIGEGASWFVKSKITGAGQLLAVAFDDYPQPIPSPVENLRPARETCERCHWPQRFSGDKLTVRTSYASDESNQASSTVLLLKIGGRTWRGTLGIHGAHLNGDAQILYTALDKQRQMIPQVTYIAPDGRVTVYNSTSTEATPEQLAAGQRRTMDCMDCHNRPAHTFQMPETAVDRAMTLGQISPALPYVKREAVGALRQEYPDRDTAGRDIAARLDNFYRTSYPQIATGSAAQIQNAIEAVQAIYLQNVFPDMKVTWGTYPNNLGHTDFPGCFRCHDGSMVSTDGRTIPYDCATCHELPAMSEANPEILTILGIRPGR